MQQTILIVEDDPAMLQYFACVFEGKYRVMQASSGQHAIRLAKQSDDIHLVILDYRLSDMTGLDVLRNVKQYRPSVPVIFLTAYGDEAVAVKAFRYGAKEYMKKPFSYNELTERVAFCLSLKEADATRRTVLSSPEGPCSPAASLIDIASTQHLKIQKALQFIDANYMTKINLADAAKRACLSKHHFSRAFKKATAVTYRDYVTRLRVQKTKELLRDPRRTITEIAHFVGYSDLNNLVRNFSKQTGQTPSEFRNSPEGERPGPPKE